MSEDPNAIKGDWLADMNPESEVVVKGALASPALAEAKVGETFQLERLGYFCVDPDSKPGTLVRWGAERGAFLCASRSGAGSVQREWRLLTCLFCPLRVADHEQISDAQGELPQVQQGRGARCWKVMPRRAAAELTIDQCAQTAERESSGRYRQTHCRLVRCLNDAVLLLLDAPPARSGLVQSPALSLASSLKKQRSVAHSRSRSPSHQKQCNLVSFEA